MTGLFIIIPAYNEQTILATVVAGIRAELAAQIVVVDDGSAPALTLKGEMAGVQLIRHCVNLGQGAALATGIEYALHNGADILVTFDADGQHDPKDIPALLAPIIKDEADIALGSRFLEKASNIRVIRKLLIRGARLFHYVLTGLRMTDAHNGLRAMNRKAATKIRITENRMSHATEIILEIKRQGLRWKEVPVHVLYTPYSRSKGQASANSIRIFFDVVLHKLFR